MTLIATLTCHPQNPVLTPQLAEKAANAVAATATYWLADGIACDIPLPAAGNPAGVETTLRDSLSGNPVDIFVQEQDERRKQVLIADMDSTMIGQECIDELAEEAGIKPQVSDITERAMNGEIPFESALIERVMLLKALPVSVIDQVWQNRISLTSGGYELVQTMKANGAHAALVSGGFTQFTTRVSQALGFDENHANVLLHLDGKLSGEVQKPILGREAKVDQLLAIAEKKQLGPEAFLAVGDGANDLGMLSIAGSGVAYHAKQIVAEQARFRVTHSDLTALLYLQGYRLQDFIKQQTE